MLNLVQRGVISLETARVTIAISPAEESALRKLVGNLRAESALRQRAAIERIFEQFAMVAGLVPRKSAAALRVA